MTFARRLEAVPDLRAARFVAVELALAVPPIADRELLEGLVDGGMHPSEAIQRLDARHEAIVGVHALLSPVIAGALPLGRSRMYLRRACIALATELGRGAEVDEALGPRAEVCACL